VEKGNRKRKKKNIGVNGKRKWNSEGRSGKVKKEEKKGKNQVEKKRRMWKRGEGIVEKREISGKKKKIEVE